MDPILAVYNVRVTIRQSEDAEPKAVAPATVSVETACATAISALVAPSGYTAEGRIEVKADAVRTDS